MVFFQINVKNRKLLRSIRYFLSYSTPIEYLARLGIEWKRFFECLPCHMDSLKLRKTLTTVEKLPETQVSSCEVVFCSKVVFIVHITLVIGRFGAN